MDMDKALYMVGGYRRYHFTMFLLLGFSISLPSCWLGLNIVFTGWEPQHHCRVSVDGSDEPLNKSIPFVIGPDGKSTLSKCRMYNKSSEHSNETIRCQDGWTYDNGGYYTIIEQWDLVCEFNYLSEMSQLVFQVSNLISTILFSSLTDKFGRKYVHIVSHLLIGGFGVAVAFSSSYVMYVVTKAVIGMLVHANLNSALIYIMEIFDSQRRAFVGVGIESQWIICYLSLPLMAYLITDWRALQIVCSSCAFIWIVYFWIMPESPLWLAAVGRSEEAEEVLRKFARWNGVDVSKEDLLLREKEEDMINGVILVAKEVEDILKVSNIIISQKIIESDTEKVERRGSECKIEEDNVDETLSSDDQQIDKHGSDTVNDSGIEFKSGTESTSEIKFKYGTGSTSVTEVRSVARSTSEIEITSGNELKAEIVRKLPPETTLLKSLTSTSGSNPGPPELNIPLSALIRDPYLRLVLLISNFLWFANCLVYYGLILSSPAQTGSRFVNFTFMGLVEIPASILVFTTIDRIGRRLTTSVYHIIAGVPLAILVFVPTTTSSGVDLSPLIITLTMLSKFGISASFAVIIIYTRELFPTSLRGTGGGICQVLGNVGNIIAPMAMYATKTRLYWLPNVLFGLVSIVVGLLVLILPETARRPLPQTLEELHRMFRSRSGVFKARSNA